MALAYAIGFAEGTGAHLLDLARGGVRAYASLAPVPIQVFFVGLVVLDPLVVLLLCRGRPSAAWLGGAVMACDVAANWYVDLPLFRDDPGWLLRPVGLLPITLFGLFVLASAGPLHRVLAGGGRARPEPSPTAGPELDAPAARQDGGRAGA